MNQHDCTSCQDELADCLDAGLTPSGELETHLAGCTACAQAWVSLQEAWTALRPEGFTLSAEAQARVMAYAAAHVSSPAAAPAVAAQRPFGGWFWGVFAVALALVIWKFTPAGSDVPAASKPSAEVAVIEPPADEKLATGPSAQREIPSGSAKPAVAPAGDPVASAPVPATESLEAVRASKMAAPSAKRAEVAKEEAKQAAIAPGQEPAVALAESSQSRLRSAAAEADDRPMAVAPAQEPVRPSQSVAAAPLPRATAPKAASREEVGAVALGNVVSDGARAVAPSEEAPPALDSAVRAAITALAADRQGGGWSRLRAAVVAPSVASFEAVLAGCGADALLCDGAALGAGAMRASARRADATPLLQRAARSADPAVAAAARRLLAGQ